MISYILNGKGTIIRLIVGSIKKDIVQLSEDFPEPKSLGGKVKLQLDLSNYATKEDLNNTTGIDTSSFVKKVDLANLNLNVVTLDIVKLKYSPTNLSNLKSKLDKLDVDQLIPFPVDLSILSDAVKQDGVKKMYIMLLKILEIKYQIYRVLNYLLKLLLVLK